MRGRHEPKKISFTNDVRRALRRILGLGDKDPPIDLIALVIEFYPQYKGMEEQGAFNDVPEYDQLRTGLRSTPGKIKNAYVYARFDKRLEEMCPDPEDLQLLETILDRYPDKYQSVNEEIVGFLRGTRRGGHRTKGESREHG